jgi:hypothetical protein
MRKRINRAAVCSSDNYSASKRVHQMYLRERHAHFNEMVVNGEITFDQPIFNDGNFTRKFKTIRVFGKEMRITIEEFREHNTLK